MHHRRAASLLLLCLTAACATRARAEPVGLDGLLAAVHLLQAEAAQSRAAVGEVVQQLQALTGSADSPAESALAYERFGQRIDAAERQAGRFRDAQLALPDAAQAALAQRAGEIEGIASERLRQLARARLGVVRTRCAAIVAATAAAEQGYGAFLRALRDHQTFLAKDLTPDALAAMAEDVALTGQAGKDLDAGLDRCVAAAQAYAAAAGAPVSTALPAAPADAR